MQKREPVEIVAAGIIHLAEAISILLFMSMVATWVIILGTRVP